VGACGDGNNHVPSGRHWGTVWRHGGIKSQGHKALER
jgi:hypothetical protein